MVDSTEKTLISSNYGRHCERSEAIQSLKTNYIHASKFAAWIASSLRSSQ
jgi:hypothetical protein